MSGMVSDTVIRSLDKTLELISCIKALEEENRRLREENETLRAMLKKEGREDDERGIGS